MYKTIHTECLVALNTNIPTVAHQLTKQVALDAHSLVKIIRVNWQWLSDHPQTHYLGKLSISYLTPLGEDEVDDQAFFKHIMPGLTSYTYVLCDAPEMKDFIRGLDEAIEDPYNTQASEALSYLVKNQVL